MKIHGVCDSRICFSLDKWKFNRVSISPQSFSVDHSCLSFYERVTLAKAPVQNEINKGILGLTQVTPNARSYAIIQTGRSIDQALPSSRRKTSIRIYAPI